MPVTTNAAKMVLAASTTRSSSSASTTTEDKANAHVVLGSFNIYARELFRRKQMHAEANARLTEAIGHVDDAILLRPNHPLQYELRAVYYIMATFGSKSLNDNYNSYPIDPL